MLQIYINLQESMLIAGYFNLKELEAGKLLKEFNLKKIQACMLKLFY
jgi:hypothetical protein